MRRISRLDDVSKFAASLESVKIISRNNSIREEQAQESEEEYDDENDTGVQNMEKAEASANVLGAAV